MAILFGILSICAGCPEPDEVVDSAIVVVNNSNRDIVAFGMHKLKTDTLLQTLPFPITSQNSEVIPPGDSTKYGGPFKKKFAEMPDKVHMIFLFSRDTLDNLSWDQITDQYLILRRYDLTLDSLEGRNWKVIFP